MTFSEIIVEEGDMTANAQAVGDDTCLDGIAEVTVDILLAGVRVGLGSIRPSAFQSGGEGVGVCGIVQYSI